LRRTLKALPWLCAALPWIALTPAPVRAQSVADLFKRVRESVVVIRPAETEPAPKSPQQLTMGSVGSGVLVDSKGLILTAAHVVESAQTILVEFSDGTSVPARIVASAPVADLALLQVDKVPPKITPAVVGDSDGVEVGDQIFIVGAPLGFSSTLTVGHVSGRRDSEDALGQFERAELLQTDAVINLGNSGGPMFSMRGEVVGIVTHMISHTGSFEGLGFAVCSETAKRLLLRHRSPWIGVEGTLLKGEGARFFNLPQEMGVLVQRVSPNSPAATMGMKGGTVDAVIDGEPIRLGGDIILAYDGVPMTQANLERIRALLENLQPEKLHTISVLRGGRILELDFVLPKSGGE